MQYVYADKNADSQSTATRKILTLYIADKKQAQIHKTSLHFNTA